MSNIEKAIEIALKAHKNQTDKAGHPYILHPLRLMFKMKTEEEMITAILHDVIEDSDIGVGALEKAGFSSTVIDALKLLTYDDALAYEDYIQSIKGNPLAVKIKLADLEDNGNIFRLNAIDEKTIKRLTKYLNAYQKLTN